MICITADFDPVHKGHEHLLKEARKIADEKGSEVAVYLNKGFSANHAPFFVNFDARAKMALELGADKIVPIEGLHHRFILSYSVPIRLSKMYDDGATDFVTGARIPLSEIAEKAEKFIKEGKFVGMPKSYPNRNEIRWYGFNEFLKDKYGYKLDFHVVKEMGNDEGKISGRAIRQSIIDNDYVIDKKTAKLLPKSTIDILEEEIAKGQLNNERNYKEIFKRLNTTSRGYLSKIAYLNGKAVNEIIKRRVHRDSKSVWAAFRRADYGPVMTRLAVSAVEMEVTKKEVMDLMLNYESLDLIPEEQSVKRVIERAWYVASEIDKGSSASEANERFRSEKIAVKSTPQELHAGLNLTKFETKLMKEGINADIYVDKDNKLSVELRVDGKKIKTNLRLPGKEVTYLRYIIDSNFIPVCGVVEKAKKGFKIKIEIGRN